MLLKLLVSCGLINFSFRVNVNQVKGTSPQSITIIGTNSSDFIESKPIVASKSESWWVETISDKHKALIIYSSLVLLTVVVTISRSLGFFRYCMTASTRLHNLMFSKIVFSAMRFFNLNPSGRILNRFSKDVGAMDETLPITMIDTIQVGGVLVNAEN